MSTKTTLSVFLFLGLLHFSIAQDIYEKNESVDIQNYVFALQLNDASNEIKGETQVTVQFKENAVPFALDLIEKSGEFGMEVTSVLENGSKANYTYANNKINIVPKTTTDSIQTYTIKYQGIPERGLVIATTKFGKRSFFGDNWPNLARHWLPAVDHPYDKASVEFQITAPEHYDVVATGKKVEESNLENGYKITIYNEPAPVATKVMTIGVTQFASRLVGMVDDIEVSAWVYPQNRLEGFGDYTVAGNVLEYFIGHIGPYSYAKLANMQAKTQWGGLENAGTIAYFENSVTGNKTVEPLIAHEIAHQWFGNSATEKSWNHVWLSEGFATYFSILYLESEYGDERRKEELAIDKKEIFDYYRKKPAPIVDLSIKDPMKVLSTNTYQKGGWVLNMLRHQLGDGVFWEGIQNYYATYQNSNVLTDDFRHVMEEISGEDLESFFEQWLFVKGHPQIKWSWNHNNGNINLNIQQLQDHHVFQFPLEIGIVKDGKLTIKTIEVTQGDQNIQMESKDQPDSIVLDPNEWTLFEDMGEM
ncbi:M1 family metallopeptidase [Flagellimonas oceanensis]|uniref:M1 family metallopeptidase n=1 Tax=Flagellimonas oceanensis TaxID=2499163 RepID=UPI003BAA4AFC|tara:strand:+ start:35718 stop:37313 length:1596 start_codon:yes stop_codon:yes gene_type:complete